MDETLNELGDYIAATKGEAILGYGVAYGELTVNVAREAILEVVGWLMDDPKGGFVNIVDVCGVDYPERENRFDVVYHLTSPKRNLRIRLKVETDEVTPVPSITPILPGAR